LRNRRRPLPLHGSGQTGRVTALAGEAIRSGIPVLAIDVKGVLTRGDEEHEVRTAPHVRDSGPGVRIAAEVPTRSWVFSPACCSPQWLGA